MDESYTITFHEDELLPKTRDGVDYQFVYSYVPTALIGQPEEEFNTKSSTILVGISGTLAASWNIKGDNLRKILFEVAKRHIKEKAEEKTLDGKSEIQLTTYNAPNRCPFNPDRINIDFEKPMNVIIPNNNPVAVAEPTSVASQIIDLRDSINAIFGEKFKGRILSLPQERHLVELFKDCNDHEAFAYRVASIGGLSTAINSSDLKKYVAVGKDQKPLNILGLFLRRECYPQEKANKIMDTLKNFNNLRRMYPVHTDRSNGVLMAHEYFNLEYPIKDHVLSGRRLLLVYRSTLELLLELLKLSDNKKTANK